MDIWTVLWLIGMLVYLASMALSIWEAVQQPSPSKIVLCTCLVAIAAIYVTLRPWETRSNPPPTPEFPLCASLLTKEAPRGRVTVNGQLVPLYVDCLGADGEMTSVRVGGDEL